MESATDFRQEISHHVISQAGLEKDVAHTHLIQYLREHTLV